MNAQAKGNLPIRAIVSGIIFGLLAILSFVFGLGPIMIVAAVVTLINAVIAFARQNKTTREQEPVLQSGSQFEKDNAIDVDYQAAE